ncbi:37464_t:CDS:1, partial [Gigaspora margarita]
TDTNNEISSAMAKSQGQHQRQSSTINNGDTNGKILLPAMTTPTTNSTTSNSGFHHQQWRYQ